MPVQVMPDDHSKSVPPLPIPNRTVKRFYADDSAATSVKVGYRQASYSENPPSAWTRSRSRPVQMGVFFRPGIREVPGGSWRVRTRPTERDS